MSHTATVSLLKIIFKQLFESSSKLLPAWCTTSYGSSIDTVFDLPILLVLSSPLRCGRSTVRATAFTDPTSDDVKRLTLVADAVRGRKAGPAEGAGAGPDGISRDTPAFSARRARSAGAAAGSGSEATSSARSVPAGRSRGAGGPPAGRERARTRAHAEGRPLLWLVPPPRPDAGDGLSRRMRRPAADPGNRVVPSRRRSRPAGRARVNRRGAAPCDRGRRRPPPLRLTRRGRAVLLMAVALLALGGFWLGTRAAGAAGSTVGASTAPVHAGPSWGYVRQGPPLGAVRPEF
jgi:hypothetical protein